ncbi:MAG: T9SS type A sorting domain-containing protein [Chitinophagaceae bacterium]|nr:T9SS type A sorting domain-containing protein [Chitinophagaceae bacterium]
MKKIFLLITVLCNAIAAMSQLYIAPGANLHLSGNAQVTLQNMSLVNDGTISSPDNGRFTFNGSADNDISGTSALTISEMEIAKTGSGKLTLQTDISVSGKIIFTSNQIELNQHNINLGSTGMLEGENENSHIVGANGGQVLCTANLNAPASVNPANLGAIITSSQNMGNTTIHRGHQSQQNNNGTGNSILRYYDITPSNNAGLNATIRFQYLNQELNALDENNLELFKSEDNLTWMDKGYSTRDANQNYVEQAGISSFSRWTLSTAESALPVNWINITAQWKDNENAIVKWEVADQKNVKNYSVQESADGITFSNVCNQPAGNNNIYQCIAPVSGNNQVYYFRIKQTDWDGRIGMSKIVTLNRSGSNGIRIYPNPVDNILHIEGLKPGCSITLYGITGKRLQSIITTHSAVNINVSQLASGSYIVVVQSVDERHQFLFIKE